MRPFSITNLEFLPWAHAAVFIFPYIQTNLRNSFLHNSWDVGKVFLHFQHIKENQEVMMKLYLNPTTLCYTSLQHARTWLQIELVCTRVLSWSLCILKSGYLIYCLKNKLICIYIPMNSKKSTFLTPRIKRRESVLHCLNNWCIFRKNGCREHFTMC